MKKHAIIFATIALVLTFVIPATADMAADSAKYDAALDKWAAGVKDAREKAKEAYNGLKFSSVQTGVAEGEMTREGRLRHTYYMFQAKLNNNSDTNMRYSKALVKVLDENGNRIDSLVYTPENTEVFAGTSVGFSLKRGLSSVWNDPKNLAIISGKCVIQVELFDVDVHNGQSWTKLNSKGTAFYPTKPRAPYYFTDEQIRIAIGKAETKAGVYEHPEKFAEPPFYPLYGMNGSFSGKPPARTEQAKVETPEYAGTVSEVEEPAAQPINGESAEVEEDEGLTLEDTVEGVKGAGETVNAISDLAKSLGGLFN